MKGSFDDIDLPVDESDDGRERRLDVEWVALNAIREMLGIALKGRTTPTYYQALELGALLAPQLLAPQSSLIAQGQESPVVREYSQRAAAETEIRDRQVEPIEVIDREIQEFTELLRTSGDRDQIARKLTQLERSRALLVPKNYTENQLILRDLFKADRDLPVPPIEGDTYQEYLDSQKF